MNSETYNAIIVLGGGRTKTGELTELSKQRLEEGIRMYREGISSKIFAMGGRQSNYLPNAIVFKETGAEVRKQYLEANGVNSSDIVIVPDGRDTIGEAFASREKIKELGYKRVLLLTSDKHLPRALYIFQRVFGEGIEIEGHGVPCGDLLNRNEEREYFDSVRSFLGTFPPEIPLQNMQTWFDDHVDLYIKYRAIHDRYHPPGKESQAYLATQEEQS